jgi:RNA polymerase sigma-70 factor (ECF subfamily)
VSPNLLPLRSVPAPSSSETGGGTPVDVRAAFHRYARYVAAIALPLLGNEDETDDLIQEVFLEAVRGIAKLREPEAIKGWLATITVRLARQRLRRRKLFRYVTWGPKRSLDDIVGRSTDPEDRMLLTQIYAVLDELPVEQRIAWTLRHMEGERLDQVARLCGCSLATAKRRIAAAHEHLKKVTSDG